MTEEIKFLEDAAMIEFKTNPESSLSFNNNGKTILEIHENGDILYNGKKIKKDIEIYYGLKEFLEGSKLDKEIKKFVKEIKDSAEKLEKMIL